MLQLFLIIFLSACVQHSRSRYVDVCPSRKISIGDCLAGLCPSESECINNVCCKNWMLTTTPSESVEINGIEDFGKCRDGRRAIGECVAKLCPTDYTCEENLCCGNMRAKTFASPNPISPTNLPVVNPSISTSSRKKEDEMVITEGDDYESTTGESEHKDILFTFSKKSTTNTRSKAKNTIRAKQKPDVEEITATRASQICPFGEAIGECVSDQCPEGHICLNGACCMIYSQINCTDKLNGCLPHLCDKTAYKEFTSVNCAKTCARCHISELTSSDRSECRDQRSDCAQWIAQGFCESTLYSLQQKLKTCGHSCNLCKDYRWK